MIACLCTEGRASTRCMTRATRAGSRPWWLRLSLRTSSCAPTPCRCGCGCVHLCVRERERVHVCVCVFLLVMLAYGAFRYRIQGCMQRCCAAQGPACACLVDPLALSNLATHTLSPTPPQPMQTVCNVAEAPEARACLEQAGAAEQMWKIHQGAESGLLKRTAAQVGAAWVGNSWGMRR